MLKFLGIRLLAGLLSMFLFLIAMFFLVNLLIPGDAVSGAALGMTPEELAALRAELGLDRPLFAQFLSWLGDLVRGGLGTSLFGFSVGESVKNAAPATIFVFTTGLVFAYLVGSWLGRLTAWRPGPASDGLTFSAVAIYAAFPAFLAFLATHFLGRTVNDLRRDVTGARRDELWLGVDFTEQDVLWTMILTVLAATVVVIAIGMLANRFAHRRIPRAVNVLLVVVVSFLWLGVVGVWPFAVDMVFKSALPLLVFTALAVGEFMVITQSGMNDVMHEDFILVARAKGLKEGYIRDRHAGRHALLTTLSKLAVSIPYLLTGLVIIETAVRFQGLGSFLAGSIGAQDMPTVMGTLVVIGLFGLLIRIGLETALVIMDPRLRSPGPVEVPHS